MKAEPVTVARFGLGLAVVATLLVSGCAAGQQAATANQKASLDGVNQTLGNIALRGLAIDPPDGASYASGSDAGLKLVIVNSGTKPDSLVSITSPVAGGWAAYRTTAEATQVASAKSATAAPSSSAGGSSASGSSASGSSASGSSASSSSARKTTTAAPAPLPSPLRSVPIAAGSRVSWGVPEAKGALLLTSIKGQQFPGTTVLVTFTFARAGSITVSVPIQLTDTPANSVLPGPSATGQEG